MYMGLANRDGDICFEYVCSLVCLPLLIQCCRKSNLVEDPLSMRTTCACTTSGQEDRHNQQPQNASNVLKFEWLMQTESIS